MFPAGSVAYKPTHDQKNQNSDANTNLKASLHLHDFPVSYPIIPCKWQENLYYDL